jgi:hypothetical protein
MTTNNENISETNENNQKNDKLIKLDFHIFRSDFSNTFLHSPAVNAVKKIVFTRFLYNQ